MIAGSVIAWLLYTKVLWKRFESQWKNEFLSAEIKENPLYQSKGRETFNPLYKGNDTTGTAAPRNSTVNRESYELAQASKTESRQSQLGADMSSKIRQSAITQGRRSRSNTGTGTGIPMASSVGQKSILGVATLTYASEDE